MEGEKPKTYTRPTFTEADCRRIVKEQWGIVIEKCKPLPSYDDQNYAVVSEQGTKYVVKAFHLEEREEVMELQDGVMERLRKAGVNAPYAVKSVRGETHVRERGHLMRVLEWVEGEDWAGLEEGQKLALGEALGALAGRIDAALAGWRSQGGAEERQWVWRTSDAGLLRHYRDSVAARQSPARVALFDALLASHAREMQPGGILASQPLGIVHNDVNDHNTLVARSPAAPPRVAGVIDLGDVCLERYCFSLGNTLFYAMLNMPLPLVLPVAARVARGYLSANPALSPASAVSAAWLGAKLRCLTSASMSGHTQILHPDDPYVGETEVPGWKLLDYIYPIATLPLDADKDL